MYSSRDEKPPVLPSIRWSPRPACPCFCSADLPGSHPCLVTSLQLCQRPQARLHPSGPARGCCAPQPLPAAPPCAPCTLLLVPLNLYSPPSASSVTSLALPIRLLRTAGTTSTATCHPQHCDVPPGSRHGTSCRYLLGGMRAAHLSETAAVNLAQHGRVGGQVSMRIALPPSEIQSSGGKRSRTCLHRAAGAQAGHASGWPAHTSPNVRHPSSPARSGQTAAHAGRTQTLLRCRHSRCQLAACYRRRCWADLAALPAIWLRLNDAMQRAFSKGMGAHDPTCGGQPSSGLCHIAI